MKILVLGYYNRGNFGDEAYKIVMCKYLPEHKLTFLCIDDINNIEIDKFHGIIIGGGDIINDYFYKKLNPFLQNYSGFKIALSIGIPFPSLLTTKYFEHYDHVFIRNYEDVRQLQRVTGTYKAHFLPDLTFILDQPKKIQNISRPICGIFLVQNLIKYNFIMNDLIKLVNEIATEYDIIFYLFNTSGNVNENDLGISEIIAEQIISKFKISIDMNTYDPKQMLDQIVKLDFAVCVRFHAHIFCMLANIPFMSISSTRKTKSLMSYAKLQQYQYNIDLDCYGTPINSNYDMLNSVYKLAHNDKHYLKNTINNFVLKCKNLLDHKQVSSIINLCSKKKNVVKHVQHFIDTYNNHDNAARLMSAMTVGYPDSSYNWGIFSKLNEQVINCIETSVDYLENIGDKFSDIITDNLFHTKYPLWIDVAEYQSYKSPHRGGWYLAIEKLAKRMNDTGILCDMYVDRTFHWCADYLSYMGKIPYTVPWTGFIHHTTNTTFSSYNIEVMLKNPLFIQSLNTCVCLFTLSPSLTKKLKKILFDMKINVRVYSFIHPIVKPDILFSMDKFMETTPKKIVQVGAWLRNYFSIYALNISSFEKTILVGKDMGDLLIDKNFDILPMSALQNESPNLFRANSTYLTNCPCRPEKDDMSKLIKNIIEWINYNPTVKNVVYLNGKIYVKCLMRHFENKIIANIKEMLQSVKIIDTLDNYNYDILLSNSIVFLHLVDSAAVNTVIECIIRNTPILINKTPGVCDLLGPEYPLYYDEQKIISENDFDNILTNHNIKNAHKYLKSLDKSCYKINHFVEKLSGVITELDSEFY